MAWRPMSGFSLAELDRDKIRAILKSVFEAYDIAPEFHRQTHALRYSDRDIKRIYDREREREIDQIRYIIEKNNPTARPVRCTACRKGRNDGIKATMLIKS